MKIVILILVISVGLILGCGETRKQKCNLLYQGVIKNIEFYPEEGFGSWSSFVVTFEDGMINTEYGQPRLLREGGLGCIYKCSSGPRPFVDMCQEGGGNKSK